MNFTYIGHFLTSKGLQAGFDTSDLIYALLIKQEKEQTFWVISKHLLTILSPFSHDSELLAGGKADVRTRPRKK